WHFRDPNLLPLRACIDSRSAILLTRNECLEELRRVLAYPQFKLDSAAQTAVFEDYARAATCIPDACAVEIEAAKALPQCGDPDDQKFLQLAWDGIAHALLTRDKLLLKLARRPILRERFAIITPENFVSTCVFAAAACLPADSS
ncbi:MAG TPA: PIN domain-containing protein, partial [Rhodocyclaceae bacterium]|nr:PIN domain-containing protein [Rhodocyclaceae bacterium]